MAFGISLGDSSATASSTDSNFTIYKDILITAPQIDWGLVLAGSATEPGNTLAGVSAYTAPTVNTLQSTANVALPTLETGIAVAEGSQIVLWNEPNPVDNGVYNLTQQGTGAQPWILTRATIGSKTESASLFGMIWEHYPTFGTTNRNYVFICLNTVAPTIGTSDITIARLPADLFPVRSFYDTDVAAGQERNITRVYASRGGSGIHVNHGLGFTIDEGITTHNGPTADGFVGTHGGFVLAALQQDVNVYGGLTYGIRGYSETIPVAGSATFADMDTIVPDDAIILGVGAYLPDGVASTTGGATWDFGWNDAPTAFATGLAFGAGAPVSYVATPHIQRAGAGSLRVTASAGNLTGGTMRVSIIYGVASMPFGFV
jgi:hypothetical protein